MAWSGLWTFVLSAGLFMFAALTVIVSIGALSDVRRFLRGTLRAKPPADAAPSEKAPADPAPRDAADD